MNARFAGFVFACLVAVVGVLGSASEVSAQGFTQVPEFDAPVAHSLKNAPVEPVVKASTRSFNGVEGFDYVLMPLSGIALGTISGFGAGLLAYETSTDGSILSGLAESVIGGGIGYIGGSAMGMSLYVHGRGLNGNAIAGAVGYSVAAVGGGLLFVAADDVSLGLGIGLAMLPAFVGSALYLAIPGQDSTPTSTSLLQVEPGKKVSLGMPAVSVQTTEDELRVSMPLLGGRF